VDRGGVEIYNEEDQAGSSSIGPKSPHVLIHFGDESTLGIFELQSGVGDEGAKSHLYIFLDGQNGLVKVIARLDDLQRTDVVFDGELDGGIDGEGLHLNKFEL
jgi:hypothetical protein